MITKNTLVLDEMPKAFWSLIDENDCRSYFTEDKLLFSEDIEIIILRTKSKITESHYKRFPNLKCVIRAGSGYDNIDIEKAKEYQVCVQNTPNANTQSAFEHTIGLLFALIKNHKQHNQNVLDNKWRQGILENYEISDLKALVVGLGRVGSRVAGFLKDYGAEVRYVDPYLEDQQIAQEFQEINYFEGLKWANIVTYHCPLYQKTKHYFSQKSLESMGKAFVINASRGSVVDIDTVVKGIKMGKILGAGIDVLEVEPWQCEGWENNEKIILTPHTGAYTQKAKQRLSEETYQVWSEFNFNHSISQAIRVW